MQKTEKDGIDHYFNIPLVVGMYEGQLNRLTPDFLADFDEYSSSRAFSLELLSTELPQMRTIPVEESVTPEHHVSTYDQLTDLILGTDGPIAVFGGFGFCPPERIRRLDPATLQNSEVLYDTILAHKKGPFSKAKLGLRLLLKK